MWVGSPPALCHQRGDCDDTLQGKSPYPPLGKGKSSKVPWENGITMEGIHIRYFTREALSSFIFQLPVQFGNLSLNTVRVSASYSSSFMALAL